MGARASPWAGRCRLAAPSLAGFSPHPLSGRCVRALASRLRRCPGTHGVLKKEKARRCEVQWRAVGLFGCALRASRLKGAQIGTLRIWQARQPPKRGAILPVRVMRHRMISEVACGALHQLDHTSKGVCQLRPARVSPQRSHMHSGIESHRISTRQWSETPVAQIGLQPSSERLTERLAHRTHPPS